ncbi:MAG: hypothetical protein QM642_10980 [Edaphocola sp.]
MRLIIYRLLLLGILTPGFLPEANATAAFYYDFTPGCRHAYESLMALRLAEGDQIIKEEIKARPANLVPVLLSNYNDCLTLLFNGNANDYASRKANFDKRLKYLEKGDPSSPWYRYALGSLYFQWAAVHIRFNDNFAAATEFRKSYNYLKDNKQKFPNFKNTQVLLGVEESLVGTLPDNYKWITHILGIKGDVRKGINQIADFLNSGSNALMREEAVFLYGYLRFNLLDDHAGALRYLDNSGVDFRGNHLFAFLKANLALNDNKAAVAEQVLRNRSQEQGYLHTPVFHYQLGIALLQKLNDDCIDYFKKFLAENTGKLFLKDAYEKMSLYYVASGNESQAGIFKRKIASAGNTITDADKQAQRYGQQEAALPNRWLVRARLLCDGGYFNEALAQMQKIDPAGCNMADLLEYNYRYARIYDLMGQGGRAINYYEQTMAKGNNRQEHFAARSALELGRLYEEQGQKNKALHYYQTCLNMKNHDYKSSLDQKAKAAISRLGR